MDGPDEITVLLVEDDNDLRFTLAELLSVEGYVVVTAATVEEAMGLLPRTPISIVITDMKLGRGLSGWDLARTLRQHTPHPPIIAFTGSEGIDALHGSDLFAAAVEKGDPILLLDVIVETLAEGR